MAQLFRLAGAWLRSESPGFLTAKTSSTFFKWAEFEFQSRFFPVMIGHDASGSYSWFLPFSLGSRYRYEPACVS
jgi:hypothetical protein